MQLHLHGNRPGGRCPWQLRGHRDRLRNNVTNPTPVCDTDDAEVPYTDVSSAPTLAKTASATACQIDQTYAVVVTNTSPTESLTLNTLTDNIYGNITRSRAAS